MVCSLGDAGCFMIGMWFALLLGVVGYWCCAIKLLIVLLFSFLLCDLMFACLVFALVVGSYGLIVVVDLIVLFYLFINVVCVWLLMRSIGCALLLFGSAWWISIGCCV